MINIKKGNAGGRARAWERHETRNILPRKFSRDTDSSPTIAAAVYAIIVMSMDE